MSDSWDDYADGWDGNASVIAYSEQAWRALKNTINIAGLRVLDFGCGTGLLTERVSRHASSVVALDPSPKMIAVLDNKRLKNVSTIASGLTQELIDESELLGPRFDLIVASSALAFVPDYPGTVSLLKKLLRKPGYIVQWDWLKEDPEASNGFSLEELTSAFERAGFSEHFTAVPFSMESSGGAMKVVMGIAKNV